MTYELVMTRTNEDGSLLMKQVFDCPIPISIIKRLLWIEKSYWKIYYDLPYGGLSGFIHYNLQRYPELAPYITAETPCFDFTYQFLMDCSPNSSTYYSLNTVPISEIQYQTYAYHEYYAERWFIQTSSSLQFLVIFECEYIPNNI